MSNKKSTLKAKDCIEIPESAENYISYDSEGNELWEIEKILRERVQNNKKEYLVKWRGWSLNHCTWEPESSFLEDVELIKDFLKKCHESPRKTLQTIKKKEKQQIKRKSKINSRMTYSKKTDDSDTKIIIRRIPISLSNQESKPQSVQTNPLVHDIGYSVSQQNVNLLKNPLQEAEMPLYEDLNDETTTQINTEEAELQGNNSLNQCGISWNDKQIESPLKFGNDSDYGSPEFSPTRLEEWEIEKMTQMLSCPSQIKFLKGNNSAPLIQDELENTDEIIIEECVAFEQKGSFRFKVTFFSKENKSKGYDYFTFEEMKMKNWEINVLDFFTDEMQRESIRTGQNITKNIKIF